MFTLFVHQSYHIQYKSFDTLDSAIQYYNDNEFNNSFIVTIESINLSTPIVLQGA